MTTPFNLCYPLIFYNEFLPSSQRRACTPPTYSVSRSFDDYSKAALYNYDEHDIGYNTEQLTHCAMKMYALSGGYVSIYF